MKVVRSVWLRNLNNKWISVRVMNDFEASVGTCIL